MERHFCMKVSFCHELIHFFTFKAHENITVGGSDMGRTIYIDSMLLDEPTFE